MKRTPLLIALGIFASIAAIIFIYDFKLESKRSTWDFIGPKAVLVYQPPATSHEIIRKAFGDAMTDFQALHDSSSQRTVDQLLQGDGILVSLNIITNDDFDFTFYIPLSSAKEKKSLTDLQQTIAAKKIQQRQRNLEGQIIYEIISPTKKIFSFAIIDQVLVASATSFLVEDAVRASVAENPLTFKKSNGKLFQLSTLDKDDGDLYVNVSEFFHWMNLFSASPILQQDIPFGKSLLTDLKIDDQSALLNGFATDSLESGKSFLSLFNRQSPVSFEMKSVISTTVASVFHYGISNPPSWFADRDAYLKSTKNVISDSLQKLSTYKFSPVDFYRTIDNELGLCLLNKRSSDNAVFIAELKDITSGMGFLEKLSEAVSTKKKDSIYSEQYSTYTIRKIDLPDFTYEMFWPLAGKSSETYFALAGKDVLFSESDALLKEFLDDIDEENTWGKSLRWNTFLQTTLQESNVDLIFDVGLLSSYLNDKLTPRWKSYFESTHFLNMERGAIQLSKLEQDYYFAGNFPLKKGTAIAKSAKTFGNVKFPELLVSKPFLVKNHDTGNMELIVQDTLNTIYLVGLNGKTEWKLNLGDKIAGEISQVDFYKNGKLQYLLITKNRIHIIDRLGRYLTGYPKSITSNSLEFSTVVDYDKSRNYRFLISDKERKIFILDKEGAQLEGWNPKVLQRNLFAAPRHYRILGKDYFIAIQDDGLVLIMNRRGEVLKNFPLTLGVRPVGDYFFEGGKDFASSTFTVVSQAGEKLQFNLLGHVVSQESLVKTNVAAHFYLVTSDHGKSSAFVRIDNSKVAALDQRGKLLFERENTGSEALEPHLFDFDSGKRIFAFTDPVQNLSYLLDEHGTSILSSPIETRHTPALHYNTRKGELMIFWTSNDMIVQTSLRWPD